MTTGNDGQLELAQLMLAAFRGRADHVAVSTAKGFEPQKLDRPLPPAWLAERHLAGVRCLGFYLLDPESKCWCSCVDFDNKVNCPDPEWRDKAERVWEWLEKMGLGPVVEVSQSGEAAHVWLFFEEATPAMLVRAWWRVVSERSGVPFREVYPKQDELSGKGLGNLVRYPLWGRSHFTDVAEGWVLLGPAECLRGLRRTSAAEIRSLAFSIGADLRREVPPPRVFAETPAVEVAGELPARVRSRLERPGSLLARRWSGDRTGMKDQSTSALVLSIACELVRQYVPTAEVAASVAFWCQENDYQKGLEARTLSRCVDMAYEYVFGRLEQRSAGAVQMRDACLAYIDSLERGEQSHVPSGIVALDLSVDGLGFGEMCVLAARPAHGKSALAMQWLDTAAASGLTCLLLSEEMPAMELGKRALLSASKLGQEYWVSENLPLLRRYVAEHYQGRAPIYVVESCNTIDRVEDVIDQFCGLHGTRVVAVDYLQLLSSRKQKRYEEVSDISRRLKQAAQRNGCALLAVCQLNREVDHRQGNEPRMSDLRDSGQLEQDADLILFGQWPHRYDPSLPERVYFVYAAKRRNGPIRRAVIETTFNAERQRFGDPADCPVAAAIWGSGTAGQNGDGGRQDL